MAVIKHKAQRVAVFIDTQNLYHSAKNLYRARVNFANVLKEAVAGRTLVRAIAYVVTTESSEEKAFFDALTKIGIETKTKDLQIFYGGAKKADWDVGMAVDAAKLAPKLDAVVAFGKSSSARLKEAADDFIDMSAESKKFLMTPSRFAFSSIMGGGEPELEPDVEEDQPKVVGPDTEEK